MRDPSRDDRLHGGPEDTWINAVAEHTEWGDRPPAERAGARRPAFVARRRGLRTTATGRHGAAHLRSGCHAPALHGPDLAKAPLWKSFHEKAPVGQDCSVVFLCGFRVSAVRRSGDKFRLASMRTR